MFGSLSNEPAGIINTFPFLLRNGSPEPQLEQKTFVNDLELGESKRFIFSEPDIQVTLAGFVRIFDANAEPVIFRHCSQ